MDIKIKRFEDLTTSELYEILRCRAEVFVVEQNCDYQDLDMLDMASTPLVHRGRRENYGLFASH